MTDEPTNNPCQLADELPPLRAAFEAYWASLADAPEASDELIRRCKYAAENAWQAADAAAVARERARCLNEIECGIWIDKTTEEVLDSIAAAIRKGGVM